MLTQTALAPESEVLPRRRRRIPVTLRIVAAFALVGLGGILWFGVLAYRQYVAFQELELAGFMCDWSCRGPDLLRRIVGDERAYLFDEIIGLEPLGAQDLDGPTLAHIASLTRLQSLSLMGTERRSAV